MKYARLTRLESDEIMQAWDFGPLMGTTKEQEIIQRIIKQKRVMETTLDRDQLDLGTIVIGE